jgi:hypothetical protein
MLIGRRSRSFTNGAVADFLQDATISRVVPDAVVAGTPYRRPLPRREGPRIGQQQALSCQN